MVRKPDSCWSTWSCNLEIQGRARGMPLASVTNASPQIHFLAVAMWLITVGSWNNIQSMTSLSLPSRSSPLWSQPSGSVTSTSSCRSVSRSSLSSKDRGSQTKVGPWSFLYLRLPSNFRLWVFSGSGSNCNCFNHSSIQIRIYSKKIKVIDAFHWIYYWLNG